MHFKINDHDFGDYSQAEKKELRIYDGEKTHTLSLPLFSTYMSNFTLHDYTIYYWGFTDQMYACSYNLKTKKHTQIRLGPSVGTDFDGVYNEPQVDDNGIVTFTLWDDENSNWTISTNGKKILSFTQKNRKLKNYDEYLKVVEKENEEAYQMIIEE